MTEPRPSKEQALDKINASTSARILVVPLACHRVRFCKSIAVATWKATAAIKPRSLPELFYFFKLMPGLSSTPPLIYTGDPGVLFLLGLASMGRQRVKIGLIDDRSTNPVSTAQHISASKSFIHSIPL